MIPARRHVEVVIRGKLQEIALEIHAENVVISRFKNDLAKKLELLRDIGSDEEVELSEGKRRCVASVGVAMQRYVAKPPDVEQSLGHIHSFRLRMFGGRLGIDWWGARRSRIRDLFRGRGGRGLAGLELCDARLKLIDSSYEHLNRLFVSIRTIHLLGQDAFGHEHRCTKQECNRSNARARDQTLEQIQDEPRRKEHHLLPPEITKSCDNDRYPWRLAYVFLRGSPWPYK